MISKINFNILFYIDQSPLRSSIHQSNLSIKSSIGIKIGSHHRYKSSMICQKTNANNIRLTVLLLFISGSFLALTLPAVVLNLIMTTKLKTRSSNFETYLNSTNENFNSDTILYYTIARLLMIINHSINFILYFVVGKRFRRDLKILCLGYWRKFCRPRHE